jgi:hypothetical protein
MHRVGQALFRNYVVIMLYTINDHGGSPQEVSIGTGLSRIQLCGFGLFTESLRQLLGFVKVTAGNNNPTLECKCFAY